MVKTFLTQKFRKIPILISINDNNIGYRVAVPDNYENYKPAKFKDINFEDIDFHFKECDNCIFDTKKKAGENAMFVNKFCLQNKGKIWYRD